MADADESTTRRARAASAKKATKATAGKPAAVAKKATTAATPKAATGKAAAEPKKRAAAGKPSVKRPATERTASQATVARSTPAAPEVSTNGTAPQSSNGTSRSAPRQAATTRAAAEATPAVVDPTVELPLWKEGASVTPRPGPPNGSNGHPDAAPVAAERPATSDAEPPLLSCRGVDMAYGPVQILFDVDFDVARGEIVALLGTNGAGKSTLLKGICGLVKPKAGTVHFAGEDVTSLSADVTTHRGISLMPGGKGVFPTLTVAENLRLASWLIRKDGDRVEAAKAEVETLFPILKERSGQMAGNLSGGEQQMLALGGALMTQPELLMIDELSLGLAPTIVAQLLEVVREIHRRGTTIVIVEQSVNVALNLAERAVFMEKGEVRFTGPTSELLERPDILRSVFIAGASAGADEPDSEPEPQRKGKAPLVAAAPAKREIAPDAPVLLECRGLIKRFGGITAVNDVDLQLREGQILGLIGHNGAGKTTLMDCISGFLPIEGGRIFVRGHDVTDWQPHERAKGGVARSFQDALLYPSLTVAETIAVARERHVASRDLVAAVFQLPASYESELAVMHKVDELIELMGLGAFRQKLTGELSTGSRRIVDLACILAQDPKVLMLDEPSGGVAQKETEALGPLLLRVREQIGCSVLVIEHDMPLLRTICDEMVALELGGIIAQGTPEEVLEHPAVIESYLGTDDNAINRSGAVAS
ncbi:MAG: ATP-binding cassette domain-containing protein [Acidimicrobiales bacterium]